MQNNGLILANEINSKEVYDYLNSSLINKRTLFLCATQNIKKLRNENLDLSNIELMTFSELKEKVYEELRKGSRFLSRADQKFVLNQVIKSLFKGERQEALYKIRNDLFELYEFLINEEVGNISEEVINFISKDFTDFERDIFLIYNKYYDYLFDIKNGKIPLEIELDDKIKNIKVKLLSEVFNDFLLKQVDDFDAIVFDGFLFFNEEQRKLLVSSCYKEKQLLFIAKFMPADKNNFLLNDLFKPLFKELNLNVDIININSNINEENNAISFVKNNYLDFSKETAIELSDGFNFIEPFVSRDREMNYIINCISKYLQGKCSTDRSKISKMLSEDIAIVIANNKEKYEHHLNVILKEIGVFFLDYESDILEAFDKDSLKDVLFKRNDFIEANIKKKNGEYLTHQEKIIAFKKLYKGINIAQKSRSFINYPIGQYILEVYRIIKEGITCEGFKKILYSNWYYNIGLDTVKYDGFVKDFQFIEPYLRKKKNIDEWIKEFELIKEIKLKVHNCKEYRYFPLRNISFDSLEFLFNQVKDTKMIVDNLSKVFGDINQHLKALNENFLLDDFLTNETVANEFEKEVIKHLKDIIDNINKSNLVTNIDSRYFSDNVKNMLMDYEREKAESAADNLTLNVVNLENMQKFKLTFFCMLEEDKYPRQYKNNFPFTSNIIKILEDPRYEIERKPGFIKTLDYHLKLEKYLFLNVLDFTTEKMIITQTEEENGKELSNSIYVEDIFSMFKQDIKYIKLKEPSIKNENNYIPKKQVLMPYNEDVCVNLSDFCSFFMCPKIYYYLSNPEFKKEISYNNEWKLNIFIPGLIYYKILYKLGFESQLENKIFSLEKDELSSEIEKYFDEIFINELKNFDFISNFEKKDIKNRVKVLLSSFIKRNIIEKGITNVSFGLSNSETIKIINELGKEFNLVIDNCLIIKNVQTGLFLKYDITSGLDYLVKSAGGNFYGFSHFKEIVQQLAEKNSYDDRIALVNYLFLKLNAQINTPRYRLDGLQRIKELTRYISKQTDSNYIPSSYCKYCKFERVCKMKERGSL